MAAKEKPPQNVAFGSSVQKRFKTLGLHPQLITVNTSNSLGPGQYNPERYECKYKAKSANWKQRLDSEEFSKFLGFRNPCLLAERRFRETLGGPGTIELDTQVKTGASALHNVGFSTEKRFHDLIKDETLPPGAHNLKEPTTKFGLVPSFEYDGFAQRFRNTEPRYRLPPNIYKFPRYCIVDKVVSKRGPYDTFTGPRDETTIKNHFAPALFKPPDKFYPVPSALDHLVHHPNKRRCGKFLQAERFPENMTIKATKNGFTMYEKDPGYPGPAVYDTFQGIKEEKETMYPFNSSNINARPPTNWKIHPGPDRYIVKDPTCHMRGKRKSWMFLSTAGRELTTVESYSNFIY